MNGQIAVGLAFMAVLAFILWPKEEVWTGVAYPSAGNLLEYQIVGEYESLDGCLSAVVARVNSFNDPNSADYECGLNCRASEMDADFMICEETKDWK